MLIYFIISVWQLITRTIVNCVHRAAFLDGEYELYVETGFLYGESTDKCVDDWMTFTKSLEEYVSVDDGVLLFNVFTVKDICEVTEDNEQISQSSYSPLYNKCKNVPL